MYVCMYVCIECTRINYVSTGSVCMYTVNPVLQSTFQDSMYMYVYVCMNVYAHVCMYVSDKYMYVWVR
jgi:hypothetical protein